MKKTGQDYIKNATSSSIGGFNSRIYGNSYNETFQYPHERQDGGRHGGWELAGRMIEEGKIFFQHNDFHHTHEKCGGHAFSYGGTWVCNKCGGSHLNKPWWIIKVMKDGNEWCCVGEEFVNLQESECYAFGSTRDEAIDNYGKLHQEAP